MPAPRPRLPPALCQRLAACNLRFVLLPRAMARCDATLLALSADYAASVLAHHASVVAAADAAAAALRRRGAAARRRQHMAMVAHHVR